MLRVRATHQNERGTSMIDLLAQAGGDQAGGGYVSVLLPLVLMGGIFYFLLIRPQRARQRQQQALMNALEVGDEVMTAGGIFGRVTAIDADEDIVTVELAPGTQVRMLRRAIAQRLVDEEDDLDDELPDEEAGSRP
jgi:preprotein translocase subunit YajC